MWHIETDFIGLAVFLTILYKAVRTRSGASRQEKAFIMSLYVGIIVVTIDILSSAEMNAMNNWLLYEVFMTLYCVSMPFLSASCVYYTVVMIFRDDVKMIERMAKGILATLTFYIVLAGSNPWTGLFFHLSDKMVYSRGVLFLSMGIGSIAFYSLIGLVLVAIYHSRLKTKREIAVLTGVFVIPLASTLLQIMNPGWLVAVSSYAVVYLLCDMTIETERRNDLLEVLRKQNVSLEEASHTKAEFFSRASHDMRTPMNGILGLTHLALREDDVSSIKNDLEKIQDAGEYMLELINDSLDMQRVESESFHMEPAAIRAGKLLENVVDMIRPTAEQKGVLFSVDSCGAEMTECYLVDPVYFKQIFVNLLSNAVKFTPKGGEVILKLEKLSTEGDITHARFQVSDTGVGMSEEFIEKNIFQPFSQEQNEMSKFYTGSGLGLAITKQIVEKMGGSIEVESTQGKGSRFSIFLDLKRVEDDQTADAHADDTIFEEHDAALEGKRILLCEDNSLNAEIASRIMNAIGCEVTVAENGREGLDTFRREGENAFFAVVMDVRMPEMDGITATKAIRAIDSAYARSVPIIAMTADAYDIDSRKAQAAGMSAYLTKPIDIRALYSTLRGFI